MFAAFPSWEQRAREGCEGWRRVFLVSYNLVDVEEMGCFVTHGPRMQETGHEYAKRGGKAS